MDPIELINTTHELSDKALIANPYNLYFWGLIAFNLISIAVIRTTNPFYLKALFSTSVYNRYLVQNSQEELKFRSIGSLLLTISYFNSIAIIISILGGFPFTVMTLEISGGVFLAFLIKIAIMRSVSFLSMTKSGIDEHYLNHLVFFQIAGIILTLFLMTLTFIPSSIRPITLILIASIIAFFIIMREFQSLIRAIKLRISLFYIILYLCTLELLPLVLLIYTLVSNIEELN